MNHPRLLRWFLCAGLFCRLALGASPACAQASDITAVAPTSSDTLESPESASVQVRPTTSTTRPEGDEPATGGPYGKGPGWVPGMPDPKPGEGGAAGDKNGDKNGKKDGNPGGLILYDQLRDTDAGNYGNDAQTQDLSDAVPDQYIVEKGDTLWSICSRFFNNPYYWPKLWSFNDAITNPHWIYPGDLITMHAPGQHPAVAQAPRKDGPEPLRPLVRATRSLPSGLFLHQNGFVEPGERDSAGTIAGSREEKIMLASLDEIYIEVNKQKPLKVKERYTIYKTIKQVRRPYGDKAVLGEVVEILGDVEVKQITSGGIARAVILEAFGPIERGFRVGPLRRTYKLVDPKIDAFNLNGVVVTALSPSVLLSNEMLIFIDLGRASGIEVGNRLFVFRRGDAYPGLLVITDADDHRYPKEVVAEIMIVDVRDKTAAGLITRSIREVRVGDRVEARKGF